MAKSLKALCKEYEVEDFFKYICNVFTQSSDKFHAISLFKQMRKNDKKDFMIELNNCTFGEFGDGPWQVELLDCIINSLEL